MKLSDKMSFVVLTIDADEFCGVSMLPIGGLANRAVFEAAVGIMTEMDLNIDGEFVERIREAYASTDFILFNVRDKEVIKSGGETNG